MIESRGRDFLAIWTVRVIAASVGMVVLAATAGLAVRVFEMVSG